MWAVAIKDRESGKIRIADEDDDNLDSARHEVHVVPCEDHKQDKELITFGMHDFTRYCICHPRIERDGFDKEIVIHEEIRPN